MKTLLTAAGPIALSAVILFFCNDHSFYSMNETDIHKKDTIFSKGERASSDYFTGTAWVNILVPRGADRPYAVGDVVFEPGCRNNWHIHPAEQLLFITEGRGLYQEKGQPARFLKKGDVVVIPPGVEHWHGAAPDTRFTHLVVTNYRGEECVEWKSPVTGAEYDEAVKGRG